MDQEYQLTYISQATVLFLLEEHPFFSEASTTSWPFLMRATYGPSILLLLLNAHSARLAYLLVWYNNQNEMSPSLIN